MDDLTKEFLQESSENLDRLDQDFVKWEKEPSNLELVKSIFRAIQTIKGTCGFLGFRKLEALAHAGESLLSLLRDGELALTESLADALLETVDAIRVYLKSIETTGAEGDADPLPPAARPSASAPKKKIDSTWVLTYGVNRKLVLDAGAVVGFTASPGAPGNADFVGITYPFGTLNRPTIFRPQVFNGFRRKSNWKILVMSGAGAAASPAFCAQSGRATLLEART
jgi:HPt (histidine-containing phosphotransfer) domain-containing protein